MPTRARQYMTKYILTDGFSHGDKSPTLQATRAVFNRITNVLLLGWLRMVV